MEISKHKELIREYPYFTEEKNQLVGYVNECKFGYQCGFLKCLCTNPKTKFKYCVYGWHTAGLIPDALCKFKEISQYWRAVSIDFFINRAHSVKNMIANGLGVGEINEQAIFPNTLLDYVNKPVNIFLIDAPKEATDEDVIKKYPWIEVGTTKPIYKIQQDPDNNIERFKDKLNKFLDGVEGIGHVPCLAFNWGDDEEFYKLACSIIKDREDVGTVNIVTRMVHGEEIQENELMNFANINNDLWMYKLKHIFKGKPFLCIAGGPSLNYNIKYIKENQDKFIIVCVSTVANILFEYGIKPDIIGTIDMKPENVKYLEALTEEQMKETYLVYEIDANYKVVDFYKGPRIMLPADIVNVPITRLIYEYSKVDLDPPIHKSGTVSNMIFQVCRYLGADSITLAGYDLCYAEANSHVDGAKLNENIEIVKNENGGAFIKYNNSTRVDAAREITANDGNKYFTSKTFYTYFLEITARITQSLPIKVYDIGEKSVKKENATYIKITDLVKILKPMKKNVKKTLDAVDRKLLTNKIVKNILKCHERSSNKKDIMFNHISNIAFIARQYHLFKDIYNIKTLENINKFITVEATKDLDRISKNALEKFKEINNVQ